MKILISAFACEPYKGSEPGVAWNLVNKLCDKHDITVITSIEHKSKIEQYKKENNLDVLPFNVIYHGNQILQKLLVKIPYHYGYNLFAAYWHSTVGKVAKRLVREHQFDLCHHLTWATFKYYDPICDLGIPFVLGPIGGGEKTPENFSRNFSAFDRFMDNFRTYHLNKMINNKRIQRMLNKAVKVIAATPDTAQVVQPYCKENCQIMQAIGINESEICDTGKTERKNGSEPLKILFLGELKFWKGIDVIIQTAKELKHRHLEHKYIFNIVGGGHNESEFKEKVRKACLTDMFVFYGRVARAEAMEMYKKNDLFFYPSYHDSGAMVVYEAMAQRIPVLVLDTGGPGLNVTEKTGFKVPVMESLEKTASAFADRILKIDELVRNGNAESIVNEASDFLKKHCTWDKKASEIDRIYYECVSEKN